MQHGGQVDTGALKLAAAELLASRHVGDGAGAYANEPDAVEPTLYGSTGAVNIRAIVGLPFGTDAERAEWGDAIRSFQREDGTFSQTGPGHALCMMLQALNLLGSEVPRGVAPLAPLDVEGLRDWIDAHDWSSTHKELWGSCAPLLADGAVSDVWADTFAALVAGRLDPVDLRATWCSPDDPAWRVVSSVYHVLETFDAACIPYPRPHLLLERLLALEWPERRGSEERTACTDGDWAWLLWELCKVAPERAVECMRQIRTVSEQRAREVDDELSAFAGWSTHVVYCYLWVTALYQHMTRHLFRGPWLYDTLNDPSLFRLGRALDRNRHSELSSETNGDTAE